MGGVTDFIFPGSNFLNFGGGGGGGGDGDDPVGYQQTPQRQLQHQAYQPNFESFWDPMAMSQAGQPSFDNPFWYNATASPEPEPEQAPVAQPPPQVANPGALPYMRYRLGMLQNEGGRPFSWRGPGW